VNVSNIFLPFGVILLALAGWTGVEPLYESVKKHRVQAVILGTTLVVVLYILFVAGVWGGAGRISPDTISGIVNWAAWKRWLVAALGLFAIGTGAVPITHEIRNALEKDLKWTTNLAQSVIVFVPALFVLAGFNNFIVVLGVAGGCFIALQYLLII